MLAPVGRRSTRGRSEDVHGRRVDRCCSLVTDGFSQDELTGLVQLIIAANEAEQMKRRASTCATFVILRKICSFSKFPQFECVYSPFFSRRVFVSWRGCRAWIGATSLRVESARVIESRDIFFRSWMLHLCPPCELA